MPIPSDLLSVLTEAPAAEAWNHIFQFAWRQFSAPITSPNFAEELTKRDRSIAPLDLFLASAGWDLWTEYEDSVEQTSSALIHWWSTQPGGAAILILDGLSLREAPWIIQGAEERGFTVQARSTGSELPGDTRSFAHALGFGQRSALENNRAGSQHKFPGATTDCTDNPWAECLTRVGAEPRWIIWHHWPDNRLHELGDQSGKGLPELSKEASQRLTDPDFWALIERLTTGRNLVITSDHGYAATGLFSDVSDPNQSNHLKQLFGGKRYVPFTETNNGPSGVPPIEMNLLTRHGKYRLVLGRRKWKSQGGYPSLTHGGLSVLEVCSPFIEISKK